ncbi:hypothetical protein [Niastella sp. OAS944]|uniref:hypothetical protein n=1 Tax=Niastella sp. OAS944 TaxID=2664089 RepID=UPI0034760B23|nr:hypothetical protein [Chitinophagaceae bacterium OAS944]
METKKITPKRPNKTIIFLKLFLKKNIIALIALIVSLTSAYFSIKNSRDTATQQAIDNTYKTFYDICVTNLSNWDLVHLYTVAESYDSVKSNIHTAISPLTRMKQAEYLLKERAFANYLLGVFEQVFYQYNQSRESGNTKRADFLKAVLDYFTGRVLRNQRLLYLWDINGGKLSIYYEESTREYYNKYVLNDEKAPLIVKPDPKGPYYLDSLK